MARDAGYAQETGGHEVKKWYIGHQEGIRTPFRASETPTKASHGHLYGYATGPFRTKRAAIWGCQYGAHWTTISEAEDAAKKEATMR